MNYPLTLTFKLLAFAPQIYVRDASGNLVGYVKQKLFRLKEAVTVFADEAQTTPVATIAADRVLDISAEYHFKDRAGRSLGHIKRHGLRSLWRAHYDIFDEQRQLRFSVHEEKPLVKVLDGIMEGIPIIGSFSGYFFHPSYLMTDAAGAPVMRMTKQAAFFEGRYRVDSLASLPPDDETRATLGWLMLTLMERERG